MVDDPESLRMSKSKCVQVGKGGEKTVCRCRTGSLVPGNNRQLAGYFSAAERKECGILGLLCSNLSARRLTNAC